MITNAYPVPCEYPEYCPTLYIGSEFAGYCLKLEFNDGIGPGIVGETAYVYTGTWTPYSTVRDCGDHWIYAGWSSYTWVGKDVKRVLVDGIEYEERVIRYDVEDC